MDLYTELLAWTLTGLMVFVVLWMFSYLRRIR